MGWCCGEGSCLRVMPLCRHETLALLAAVEFGSSAEPFHFRSGARLTCPRGQEGPC